MPTIHTPKKRHTVRPYRFRLNSDHPLGQGLVGAYLGQVSGSGTLVNSKNNVVKQFSSVPGWDNAIGRRTTKHQQGSTQYCDIEELFRGLTQWTISLWLKIATLSDTMSPGFGDVASPPPIAPAARFRTSDNKLHLYASDGSNSITNVIHNTALSVDEWYHVVYRYDGTSSASNFVFVNGVDDYLSGSISGGITLGSGLDHRYANGLSGSVRIWSGELADVMVHDRAITVDEIRQLANPDNVMLSGLIEPLRQPPTYFFTEPPPSEAKTGIFESLIIGV